MKTFDNYLQSKGLSSAVIKRYQAEIDWYTQWLKKRKKQPENATKKDILDYLKNENRPNSGVKKTTVKRKLTNRTKQCILGNLNHFYSYLVLENTAHQNITQFIKIRGAKRKHLRPLLTPEELEQLCDAYYYFTQEIQQPNKYRDLQKDALERNYIVLSLVIYQGVNIHEIQRLTKEDIDLHKATITVHRSRKANKRVLPLQAAQMGALMAYLATNEVLQLAPSGNHIQALNKQLRELTPKYEDFIQIRTSVITNWIKIHGLRKAQYLAGHRYISSTENYLANDFESLQNDLENFHPLN